MSTQLLWGLEVLRRDISIWLIEVLSTTERMPNTQKEADPDGSEASRRSSDEA